jgi:hypothetical protein
MAAAYILQGALDRHARLSAERAAAQDAARSEDDPDCQL